MANFLHDQRHERNGSLGKNDGLYEAFVPYKERERLRLEKLREKQGSSEQGSSASASSSSLEVEDNEHFDPLFVPEVVAPKRSKKPDYVLMKVPVDLVSGTAGTAERYGIPLMGHTAILANVVSICEPVDGGDSGSFVLSKSSTERKRTSQLETKAAAIKQNFI